MKKSLIIILLSLASFVATAQIYIPIYTWQDFKTRVKFSGSVRVAVDTAAYAEPGCIAFINDVFYVRNSDKWSPAGGGTDIENLGDGYRIYVPGEGLRSLKSFGPWFNLDTVGTPGIIRMMVTPAVGWGLYSDPFTDTVKMDTNVVDDLFYKQRGNAFGTTSILGTTDNQQFDFITNNTRRASILSNGRWTIGQNAADSGYGFQVHMSAYFNGTNGITIQHPTFATGSNIGYLRWVSTNALRLQGGPAGEYIQIGPSNTIQSSNTFRAPNFTAESTSPTAGSPHWKGPATGSVFSVNQPSTIATYGHLFTNTPYKPTSSHSSYSLLKIQPIDSLDGGFSRSITAIDIDYALSAGSLSLDSVIALYARQGRIKLSNSAWNGAGGGSAPIITYNITTGYLDTIPRSSVGSGASVSDAAYDAITWDGVTGIAPSKNAIRDALENILGQVVDFYNSDGRGSPLLYQVSDNEAYLRTILPIGYNGITSDTTLNTDSTIVPRFQLGGDFSGTRTLNGLAAGDRISVTGIGNSDGLLTVENTGTGSLGDNAIVVTGSSGTGVRSTVSGTLVFGVVGSVSGDGSDGIAGFTSASGTPFNGSGVRGRSRNLVVPGVVAEAQSTVAGEGDDIGVALSIKRNASSPNNNLGSRVRWDFQSYDDASIPAPDSYGSVAYQDVVVDELTGDDRTAHMSFHVMKDSAIGEVLRLNGTDITLPYYGSGNVTGTQARYLGVNSSGKVIEIKQLSETSITSSATPTPTGDARENYLDVTALATGATFGAPTGTPTNHNMIVIVVKDNNTPQSLAFNAAYAFGDIPAPTITVSGKIMKMWFMYSTINSKYNFTGLTGGF